LPHDITGVDVPLRELIYGRIERELKAAIEGLAGELKIDPY
jgi:hypothetical protein